MGEVFGAYGEVEWDEKSLDLLRDGILKAARDVDPHCNEITFKLVEGASEFCVYDQDHIDRYGRNPVAIIVDYADRPDMEGR